MWTFKIKRSYDVGVFCLWMLGMHNDRQTGLIDRTASFQQSLLLQMAQRVVDHILVPWPRFLASEYLLDLLDGVQSGSNL